MTPFAQLSELIQDMFGAAELRDLIRRLRDGQALVDALPEGRGIALLAGDAVDVLNRRGRVDPDLFAALSRCRPDRHAEIAAVAGSWGVQEPKRPASASAPGHSTPPSSGDLIFNGPVSIVGGQVGTGTMTQVTSAAIGQQNRSRGSQGLGSDSPPNAAKHTRIRTDPMPELPRDLIDLLAEEYPDTQSARALWKRAGGSNRQVENISKPGDLWQKLWLRSVRGASVRPAALLRAALDPDELPNNAVLIRHLRLFAPPNSGPPSQRIVAAIEAAPVDLPQKDTLEILAEWEVVDELDSFAAICPALEGRISAKRRGELRETLQAIAGEIRAGTLTGVVKAGTSAAVKALLAGLAATAI